MGCRDTEMRIAEAKTVKRKGVRGEGSRESSARPVRCERRGVKGREEDQIGERKRIPGSIIMDQGGAAQRNARSERQEHPDVLTNVTRTVQTIGGGGVHRGGGEGRVTYTVPNARNRSTCCCA